MNNNSALTVEGYLSALPEEQRLVVSAVRELILHHLPEGYHEGIIHGGMIGYMIPLERFPHTYNGKPLSILALAAQ